MGHGPDLVRALARDGPFPIFDQMYAAVHAISPSLERLKAIA
jgi:hypothetical protein